MFKPVASPPDFVAQEHEILQLWAARDVFHKLRQLREAGPHWSFIDGPITANNPMGVHHGWGRTYKDLFHRFESMRGRSTRYQNGFDCQGLWVEVNVEREMGFTNKKDIEAFGLAEFVLLCKQRVLEYAAIQTEQSIRLGYWMDWDNPETLRDLKDKLAQSPAEVMTLETPSGLIRGTVEHLVGTLGERGRGGSYFTFSDENNYTIWAVLKSCYERGWLYKGHDVMPWCARCGTGLSQHEIVTEGYQELTQPSLTVRFPLRDRPGESLLVWTTTPWTLTSNVAAAVGPEIEYVRVRQGDEVLYLGAQTLQMLKGPYVVEGTIQGKALEGWRYEGPFDALPAGIAAGVPEAHIVLLWDEVGVSEGTGIVHIAPGCGAEDFALGKAHKLPVLAPLTETGIFVDGFGWLSGRSVHDVAQPIFEELQARGLAYRFEDYTHRYPVCWRCASPLVFRLVDEWFISMGRILDKPFGEVTEEEKRQNLRYQMMEVVQRETEWHPSFGLERELDWLRNMHDWMISKKRYWGLALPIYECAACGNFEVLGSEKELRDRAVSGWEMFEGHTPHRPYIDAVVIACSKCGAPVHRIPDVGNPWLDAGIVAMSTLDYRSDRGHWSSWFPADLISESFPGQFRNWFYSLIAMSTILERRAPFRNVFSYATLVAEDGRAMHKSWGNSIDFNEAADRMGVDVMRWMYCVHRPEKDLLFGYGRADEVRRQFLLPLWNVYSFFVTYARLDDWRPASDKVPRQTVLDRWILARLAETMDEATRCLEAYEPHLAAAAIGALVDDLSNWYLRRSRRRFWAGRGDASVSAEDKGAGYATLYRVLMDLGRLLAPFTPFVTEAMYQNLVRSIDADAPDSIHHTLWPEPEESWRDPVLVREMSLVKRVVSLGHAARNASGRKVRQPLLEAAIAVPHAREAEILKRFQELIAEELNVKSVRFLDRATEAVEYRLNPLPRQLGQKHGARYPSVRSALMTLNPEDAAAGLLRGESVTVEVDGAVIPVLPEEVEVRIVPRPGLAAVAEGPYLVALSTELTPELELEGLAREFIRRAQDLRKQADLPVQERVEFVYAASPRLAKAVDSHRDWIAREILATRLLPVERVAGTVRLEDEFDGESLELALARQHAS
ncbi:MAG: class I tRNA ligase family protein [Anaerolineales bacterium]